MPSVYDVHLTDEQRAELDRRYPEANSLLESLHLFITENLMTPAPAAADVPPAAPAAP